MSLTCKGLWKVAKVREGVPVTGTCSTKLALLGYRDAYYDMLQKQQLLCLYFYDTC